MTLENGYSKDLGGVRIRLISGGKNRLDGGGMLGILPKVIWNRWYPADELNRISLETHCLLIERGEERFLIESGCGDKLSEKEKTFYSVEEGDWIGANLRDLGIHPEGIAGVAITHLHTDHAGGVVTRDGDRLVPTFPNAEVVVSKQELETAQAGEGITPNAYNPLNYEPLLEKGLVRTVDGDGEIAPGIRFLPTPGHTLGHVSILIEGERESAVFTGDLLPLAKQVVPQYNMAYDTHPVLKAQTKLKFFKRAYEQGWLLILSHEPKTPIGRVQHDPDTDRYSWVDASQ